MTPEDLPLQPELLSREERERLLVVARRSLNEALRGNPIPPSGPGSGRLFEPRGAFVSLHCRQSSTLRGCLGEFIARRPLIEAVAEMAVAAATRDPRFPRVTIDELPELRIEISALTPTRPIRPSQVRVGVHGLRVIHQGKQGLLLPHVAPALGWDRETLLVNLCLKAGLPPHAWKSESARLLAFRAEVWEED